MAWTDTLAALPDAAKLAWAWRAFNQPAVDGLRALPNAKIVTYEDLCSDTEAMARDLFTFAGLDWNSQTASFISQSTSAKRGSGYFDSSDDLRGGRSVATHHEPGGSASGARGRCRSPPARYLPDLAVKARLSQDLLSAAPIVAQSRRAQEGRLADAWHGLAFLQPQ